MLFPLVGLFHVLWLLWTIWDDRYTPFLGIEWLQVLWIMGFTAFWTAACDLRKWGALGYIFLTLLDAALYLGVRNNMFPELYISNMFLLDGLFSFFLLFYYKKFR
jgi:hypothetical protein